MFHSFSKLVGFFLIFIAVSSASASSPFGGRILNGSNANPNTDTFVVRINSVIDRSSPTAYLSTGCAISERVVVTVAQAIHNFNLWFVFYNSTVKAEQDVQESQNATAHELFNPANLNNNIGVIILNTPLNNFISILTMPSIGVYRVFGFGLTATNEFPTTLQEASASIFNFDDCVGIYGNTMVTGNNFCVTPFAGTYVANGDQGGPLVPFSPQFQIAGFVSFWGNNVSLPIVLERVSAYENFLAPFL